MAELSNIAADLSRGRNVEANLSKYAAGLNSLYNRIGYVKLALNIYTFGEVYGEDAGYTGLVEGFANRLAKAVRKGIISFSADEADRAAKEIDALRNELIAHMEVLTAYADRYQIYEYVLNRIEYNYRECDVNPEYYEDKFEKDILNYIVSDKDNTVVNMKIGQVIGQLPMRLSKNKFFELLREAFTVYKGADTDSVDNFIYRIRSVAMLHTPEQFDSAFPELKKTLDELNSYTYTGMSKEDYDRAAQVLAYAGEYVAEVTDLYVLLMETVNDAYTVILSEKEALTDSSEKQHCIQIIETSLCAVENKELPADDSFDSFVAVEGVQERLMTQLSGDSYALDDVRNSYMDIAGRAGLDEIFNKLFKMELLNSGSNFMKLETVSITQTAAGNEYIEQKYSALAAELEELFSGNERVFNRAVMAQVLSSLPVFFNNMDEIKSYIHVALGQCRDEAERLACMKLMLELMN